MSVAGVGIFGNRTAFSVELRSTGVVLEVPADKTLLQIVRQAVPGVRSSCGMGTCGTCATPVLGGLPEHRDQVLLAEERARNDQMMICVGRSRTPLLVLDL